MSQSGQAPHFFTAPVQYAVVDSEGVAAEMTTTSDPVDDVVLVYHSMAANGNSMTLNEEDASCDPIAGLPEQPSTASDNSGDVSTSDQPMYLGRLAHKDQILLIQEPCIDIGRNSTKSNVHFHVSKNSFISRKHLQLTFQPSTGDFYLICLSKNGIFLDKSFYRNLHEPIKLQKSQVFVFFSIERKI